MAGHVIELWYLVNMSWVRLHMQVEFSFLAITVYFIASALGTNNLRQHDHCILINVLTTQQVQSMQGVRT